VGFSEPDLDTFVDFYSVHIVVAKAGATPSRRQDLCTNALHPPSVVESMYSQLSWLFWKTVQIPALKISYAKRCATT